MSANNLAPEDCCEWSRCKAPPMLTYSPDGGPRVALCEAHWTTLAAAETPAAAGRLLITHLGLQTPRIEAWHRRQTGIFGTFFGS